MNSTCSFLISLSNYAFVFVCMQVLRVTVEGKVVKCPEENLLLSDHKMKNGLQVDFCNTDVTLNCATQVLHPVPYRE